jgi:uncharacterized protein YajQ (UPF0234 family)
MEDEYMGKKKKGMKVSIETDIVGKLTKIANDALKKASKVVKNSDLTVHAEIRGTNLKVSVSSPEKK